MTGWLVASAPALAQAPPLGSLVTPPLPGVLPAPQPRIAPPAIPAAPPVTPVPPGPPVHIDAVRVEGITVYSSTALVPLLAGIAGANVPRSRLDAAIEALQVKYRTDGYILTVVRGEVQTINQRTVFILRAIEGYISEVKLDGDIGPAGALVYKYLEHLTQERPLNNAELERYLLLVDDIPGVSVHAVLRHVSPQPGAVQLVAELSRRPFSAFFQYDNLGPQFAGPNELLLSGTSNSFTSLGEQIQGLFYNTFNREELFGQVNASVFLGSEGLKLFGYAGKGNSLPGGALAQAAFNGNYTVGDIGLSYPIIRSRRLNLSLAGSFDTYDSTVETSTSGGPFSFESHLRMLRLNETLDFQDTFVANLPAANLFILGGSKGLPILGASSNGSPFSARPGVNNDFAKLDGEFTRLQNLASFGDSLLALKLAAAGQYTNEILPPSEEFFFGGVRWGRGFYYGEVTGDRAVATSVELQLNTGFSGIPLIGVDHRLDVQFFGFDDFGRAFNLEPGQPNQSIDSAGIGGRSNVTTWLFAELAAVRRVTTQLNGTNGAKLADWVLYSRVTVQF